MNRDTFRIQIPRILQSKKAVKIEVIGENLFLLDFASVVDRRFALEGGPWTFFKDLVIFKAPSGCQQAANMVFDELTIWVQCHNLPLAYMHSSILQNVGARLGKVVEIEAENNGSCVGKYARICVMLDISKPLRQGIWVQQENSRDEICIILLYECLPQFCYLCGCLGHVLRDCVNPHADSKECTFGAWLCAPLGGGARKFQSDPNFSIPRSGSYLEPSKGLVWIPMLVWFLINIPYILWGLNLPERSGSDENIFSLTKHHQPNVSTPSQQLLITASVDK